jgi:hypothetical protein
MEIGREERDFKPTTPASTTISLQTAVLYGSLPSFLPLRKPEGNHRKPLAE